MIDIAQLGYPFEIEVKRTARARRVSLRLKRDRSGFQLTMPYLTLGRTGLAFIKKNEAWLYRYAGMIRTEKPAPLGFAPVRIFGEEVSFQMVTAGTEAAKGKGGVWREGAVIYVAAGKEHIERRVKEYLKKELLCYVRGRVAEYARDYALARSRAKGGKLARIAVRDNVSRWGSCSSEGALSFSFRLVFKDKELVDYVVAHELAHFAHMDHSADFWRQVRQLYPAYLVARRRLKG